MPYVLVRDDGAYVAPRGHRSAYAPCLQHARVFATREAAERERCGNERIVAVADAVRVPE